MFLIRSTFSLKTGSCNLDLFNKQSIICAVSVFAVFAVLYLLLDEFLHRFFHPLVIVIILAIIGFVNGYVFGNDIKLSVIIMIVLEELYVAFILYKFFVLDSGASGASPALNVSVLEVATIVLITLAAGLLLGIAISMILYLPAYYAFKIKNRSGESA